MRVLLQLLNKVLRVGFPKSCHFRKRINGRRSPKLGSGTPVILVAASGRLFALQKRPRNTVAECTSDAVNGQPVSQSLSTAQIIHPATYVLPWT